MQCKFQITTSSASPSRNRDRAPGHLVVNICSAGRLPFQLGRVPALLVPRDQSQAKDVTTCFFDLHPTPTKHRTRDNQLQLSGNILVGDARRCRQKSPHLLIETDTCFNLSIPTCAIAPHVHPKSEDSTLLLQVFYEEAKHVVPVHTLEFSTPSSFAAVLFDKLMTDIKDECRSRPVCRETPCLLKHSGHHMALFIHHRAHEQKTQRKRKTSPSSHVAGRGSFSTVYRRSCGSHYVAAKCLKNAFEAETESKICAMLPSHPNIALYLGRDSVSKQLLFEYVGNGYTLEELIRDRFTSEAIFTLEEIVCIARQLFSALAAIHSANIVHGDLAPRNVLVSEPCVLKIADFGLASMKDADRPDRRDVRVSVHKPPEVWAAELQGITVLPTPAMDMFSMGIVLVELASLTILSPTDSSSDVAKVPWKVRLDHIRHVLNGFNDSIPKGEFCTIMPLIARLLSDDPARRPNCASCLAHLSSDCTKDQTLALLKKRQPTWTFCDQDAAITYLARNRPTEFIVDPANHCIIQRRVDEDGETIIGTTVLDVDQEGMLQRPLRNPYWVALCADTSRRLFVTERNGGVVQISPTPQPWCALYQSTRFPLHLMQLVMDYRGECFDCTRFDIDVAEEVEDKKQKNWELAEVTVACGLVLVRACTLNRGDNHTGFCCRVLEMRLDKVLLPPADADSTDEAYSKKLMRHGAECWTAAEELVRDQLQPSSTSSSSILTNYRTFLIALRLGNYLQCDGMTELVVCKLFMIWTRRNSPENREGHEIYPIRQEEMSHCFLWLGPSNLSECNDLAPSSMVVNFAFEQIFDSTNCTNDVLNVLEAPMRAFNFVGCVSSPKQAEDLLISTWHGAQNLVYMLPGGKFYDHPTQRTVYFHRRFVTVNRNMMKHDMIFCGYDARDRTMPPGVLVTTKLQFRRYIREQLSTKQS